MMKATVRVYTLNRLGMADGEAILQLKGDVEYGTFELGRNERCRLDVIPEKSPKDCDGDTCRNGRFELSMYETDLTFWPDLEVKGFLAEWRAQPDVAQRSENDPCYVPPVDNDWTPQPVMITVRIQEYKP